MRPGRWHRGRTGRHRQARCQLVWNRAGLDGESLAHGFRIGTRIVRLNRGAPPRRLLEAHRPERRHLGWRRWTRCDRRGRARIGPSDHARLGRRARRDGGEARGVDRRNDRFTRVRTTMLSLPSVLGNESSRALRSSPPPPQPTGSDPPPPGRPRSVQASPSFLWTWRPSGSRYFIYQAGPLARSTRKTCPVGTLKDPVIETDRTPISGHIGDILRNRHRP